MSAGGFTQSFYQSNLTGLIHPIKVQEETLSLTLAGQANTAPAGPADIDVSAEVGGSRRSYGLKARLVRIQFTGTPPTGYETKSTITLPWLSGTTFPSITRGATGTYTLNGTSYDVKVRGKTNEEAN